MIFTVGHGARRAAELVEILQEANVRTLVDVRAFPVSRRHPHFSRENLQGVLADASIAYEWHGKALGGYREVPYSEHIADWLAARGRRVVHLLAPGRAREHALDPQEDLWPDV